MNRTSTVVLTCAAMLMVLEEARAQDACEFEQVDLDSAYEGWFSDLNNRGQAVGTMVFDERGFDERAFVWHDGTTRMLPALAEAAPAGAEAINDLGRIVGWSDGELFEPRRAVIWLGDAVVALQAPSAARATAINNRGQIAGVLNTDTCAFWSNSSSAPELLPGLGGSWCHVYDISEGGATESWAGWMKSMPTRARISIKLSAG